MDKTFWVFGDDLMLSKLTFVDKLNLIEVFKKSDVETFGKSFIKTIDNEIKEEGNIEVATGLSRAIILFEKQFKTKLLGDKNVV